MSFFLIRACDLFGTEHLVHFETNNILMIGDKKCYEQLY